MMFHRMLLLAVLAGAVVSVSAGPASAQSLCDLVPAAVVQTTLGIPATLTATANAISDTGLYKTIFDQRLQSLGSTQQLVSGVGDAAYYDLKQHQQIPKYPNDTFTQQSIVFRAKGKIVNFILMIPGGGVAKASMLALANYAITKPLNTLKDPS
jgi:hypothetical protein